MLNRGLASFDHPNERIRQPNTQFSVEYPRFEGSGSFRLFEPETGRSLDAEEVNLLSWPATIRIALWKLSERSFGGS